MRSQHDDQTSSSITTTGDLEYTWLVFSTNLHDPIDLNCCIRNHSFETEMIGFIEQTNKQTPPHSYFTSETSDTETTFLETKLLRRLKTRTSSRATHQQSKGTAERLLRTNSSKNIFEELIQNIKSRQRERGYPENLVQRTLRNAT